MRQAGWYRAADDPPETFRYWDGTQWTGTQMTSAQRAASAPMPTAAVAPTVTRQPNTALRAASALPHRTERQSVGGYDLISPMEAQPPAEAMQHVVVNAPRQRRRARSRFYGSRSDRLGSSGVVLLILGLLLGIAVHNMATVFDTPTEITGTVTESSVNPGRRGGTVRVEITTAVGRFYTGGRPRTFTPQVLGALDANQRMDVTVTYSERTGGLIEVREFGEDRRFVGKYLWPGLAAITFVLASVRLANEYAYRDRMFAFFLLIYLVIGPLAGWFAVGPLDTILTTLFNRP